MNKTYKPTILRIITNSTFNCIMIVLMILVSTEFFLPDRETFLYIVAGMLEATFLIAIILFTIKEYRFTSLFIDKNGINNIALSSKKKNIFISYKDIKDVKIESYNLKIYYNDTKLVLDYYKEYKEIYEIIKKELNKI